jgi:hypothetical protein
MSFNAESLFSKIQEREQSSSGASASSFDSLILKPKVGCSYSLRLLWLKPFGTCTREYPMINQYIHHFWDDNAVGSKDQVVYCPTSQYIKGDTRDGFDSCPICAKCSELYKQSKEGSSSATDLYKKFRRTLRGFVPVYVVNGPEDVIGKVMIFQYGKQFKEFFDRKIFGKMPKVIGEGEQPQPISADEIIGLDAFLYARNDGTVATEGYNFNIQVTSKRMVINGRQVDMPQYTMDFSRKASNILDFDGEPVTESYMDSLNAKIRFDEDFFNISTTADLTKFKLKYIDVSEVVEEEAVEEQVIEEPAVSMNPFKKHIVEEVEETPVVKVETSVNTSDDDIDVDALIDGL